jgi:hypothetical protein
MHKLLSTRNLQSKKSFPSLILTWKTPIKTIHEFLISKVMEKLGGEESKASSSCAGFGLPIDQFFLKAYIQLKVHKRENFLGFDFEICTFS